MCQRGYYCPVTNMTGYTQYPCIAGRYCGDGTATADGTGPCAPGYFCPTGSATASAVSCPVGASRSPCFFLLVLAFFFCFFEMVWSCSRVVVAGVWTPHVHDLRKLLSISVSDSHSVSSQHVQPVHEYRVVGLVPGLRRRFLLPTRVVGHGPLPQWPLQFAAQSIVPHELRRVPSGSILPVPLCDWHRLSPRHVQSHGRFECLSVCGDPSGNLCGRGWSIVPDTVPTRQVQHYRR
jgi:hypothetical protein